ncbi:hypothetical protein V8G54_023700 [Vigna mungo]|uniref:Epidermal patterning factor-like protein n=1 Tax=Vigna mungo TaxID=3915 RepID=A0AAQ3N4L5_VIGMU
MELYPTGSALPDCSHACGSCFPCKRVIVSYKCMVAESCPVVYRCMCKGKYYHEGKSSALESLFGHFRGSEVVILSKWSLSRFGLLGQFHSVHCDLFESLNWPK